MDGGTLWIELLEDGEGWEKREGKRFSSVAQQYLKKQMRWRFGDLC
jgi:hypothetical protein